MAPPLISLCTIVRDEEQVLRRCLDSVKPYVDEMILVDTGSTDGTVRLARQSGARVIHHAWHEDFSEARNVALEQARGRFVLAVDADEWIEGGCTPRQLRCFLRDTKQDAFRVTLVDHLDADRRQHYALVRLFRNRATYRYEGAFHEQITPAIARHLGRHELRPPASPLVLGHDGYSLDRRSRRDKAERNLRLLRRRVETCPADAAGRYFLIRELLPFKDGRVVPGAHVGEALEHCMRFDTTRRQLPGPLAADLTRLHAAALLADERAGEALDLLERHADDSPAFELLRVEAHSANGASGERIERAIARLRDCFDCRDPGSLPVTDVSLTGPVARARVAEALLRLGRRVEARRIALEAAALRGGGCAAWNVLAAIEREASNSGAALEAYLGGVKIDPHDPWAWAGIGEVLLEQGSFEAALEPLNNALALAPGWRRVQESLANARSAERRHDPQRS